MKELLSNLELDTWYMLFAYLGALLVLLSFFIPVQWLTNKQVGLFGWGLLLIGIGEWKNHKFHSWIKEANAYTGPPLFMQTKIRNPDLLGSFFNLLGVILIIYSIVDILKFSF